jgi:hypothetical protein
MSLNNIIFENIDEDYAYRKYADFTVIIMKKNRYINATRLCNEHGKKLDKWTRNDGNKELIELVNNKIIYSFSPTPYTALVTNNDKLYNNTSIIQIQSTKHKGILRGTYVHELLIPHIASWISPRFGIMVSEIINNHIVTEYIKTLNQKDTIIKERDDKIEELIKLMKESDIKAEKRTRKIIDKLEDTHLKLDETSEQLNETNIKLTCVNKKLNIAVEDRVPQTKNIEKLEDFVLLKSKKKRINYRYYGVRGQPNYVNRKSNKKIIEDKYIEILRINNVSNAVNLWNRLKEQLNESVDYCGNEMNLIDINEIEFINIIKNIYEERKYIEIENNNLETDTLI